MVICRPRPEFARNHSVKPSKLATVKAAAEEAAIAMLLSGAVAAAMPSKSPAGAAATVRGLMLGGDARRSHRGTAEWLAWSAGESRCRPGTATGPFGLSAKSIRKRLLLWRHAMSGTSLCCCSNERSALPTAKSRPPSRTRPLDLARSGTRIVRRTVARCPGRHISLAHHQIDAGEGSAARKDGVQGLAGCTPDGSGDIRQNMGGWSHEDLLPPDHG